MFIYCCNKYLWVVYSFAGTTLGHGHELGRKLTTNLLPFSLYSGGETQRVKNKTKQESTMYPLELYVKKYSVKSSRTWCRASSFDRLIKGCQFDKMTHEHCVSFLRLP
jgi:hypothetical protein